MKKGIIYGLGLLFFLVICCSQDVLEAADVTNPVKLNVNAKKITNRIHYTNTAGTDVAVNLGWAEKVVLGDTGEVAITVTIGTLSSAPTKGDLIIKADVLSSSDPAGTMSVASGWLKYDSTGGIVQSVEVVKNGKTASGSSEVVEIADLNSLCLIKDVNPTTAYLFNFISSLSLH